MSGEYMNQDAALSAAIAERTSDLRAFQRRLIAADADPSNYSLNYTERNRILVGDVSHLPLPVDGVITLLPGTMLELRGLVDLGSNRLELSYGCSIIGTDPGRDGIMTNVAGPAITATDIGQVIMREFFVVNIPGSAFDITTTTDHHVNFFFVGVLGSTFGTITGGRVTALEFCYSGELNIPGVGTFRPTGGVTFAGEIAKAYVVNTPFEDMDLGTTAITFDSTLVANAIDIKGNFFKGDNGNAVVADAGYSVVEGIYSGNIITDDLLDGNIVPVTGFDPADPEWTFQGNTGVQNSVTLGLMSMDVSAVTNIVTVDVPVKVSGTTTPSDLNEDFSHSNNRLTYTGKRPARVSATASCYITSAGNNKEYQFWVVKNNTPVESARATVRIATGGDRRAVTVIMLVELVTDDYLELWVECLTDDTDLTVLDMNFLVRGV